MAEISVQLHLCLNTMKKLSREKRDEIINNQNEVLRLKKEYEALGASIKEKEIAHGTVTRELEELNIHIKETQQSYKKILDSTNELMKQVKDYNPSKSDKVETIIDQTLDDLKRSHQEIQMTNFTIAKNKQATETELNRVNSTDGTGTGDDLVNITSNDDGSPKLFSSKFRQMKNTSQKYIQSTPDSTVSSFDTGHTQSDKSISLVVE